jgi:hypothetical protein
MYQHHYYWSFTAGGMDVIKFGYSLCNKDQANDLIANQRKAVKRLLETERKKRQPKEI